MKKTLLLPLFIACLFKSSSECAILNILTNGSFEEPGAGATRELSTNSPKFWSYLNLGNSGGGWHGVNGIGSAELDQTPYGSRLIELGNGSSNPGNGIYQNIEVELGATYVASIFAKKYSVSWNEPVAVTIEIRNQNGEVINSGWKASSSSLSRDNSIWQEVIFTFSSLDTSALEFWIFDSTSQGAAPNSDLFVDNAMVYVIPEPSSLSLLLAGGAVLAAGRRRIKIGTN